MEIGGKFFDTHGGCHIMGILNVTPDSFSDGGRASSLDAALFRVEEMLGEGMEILDIGGESNRPVHTPVSDDEEISRTAPVIRAVKERFDVPVSLDTHKYTVARSGIEAGADMINDIWGLRRDNGEMARVIAENKLPCCLMHNRASNVYGDLLADIESDLRESLAIAENAGIPRESIILDAGIGFAKDYRQSLEAIRGTDVLISRLGMPFLLGVSRKSVIGTTLGLPVEERLEGTIAANVIGVMKGASFIRVHDVKENARAVKMALALMKG